MKVAQMALYRTIQQNLNRSSSNMNDLYLQASTGSRLSRASDDPSSISPVLSSRTEIAVADRHLDTIAETQDRLDILDGYLDSAESILVRAKEITVASINGSLSDQDLETYADEVNELQAAMLDIANAKVDGKYIFSGYAEKTLPFSGDPVVFNGTSNHIMVEISTGQTVQSNLTGDELFTTPNNVFSFLDDLKNALNSGDTTALETSLEDLEGAADQVRGKRSEMGNINNRLDDVSTLAENLKLQMQERLSTHEDADLVEVMSGITQAEQAYEAALAVSARISQLSILNYL